MMNEILQTNKIYFKMYFWETCVQTGLLYMLVDLTVPYSHVNIRVYQLYAEWKTMSSAGEGLV